MGRCIARLAPNEYVEWSTVVDAPVTYAMSRNKAVEEFGEERIARADTYGTSMIAPRETLETLIMANRAGPDEARLSLAELRQRYA